METLLIKFPEEALGLGAIAAMANVALFDLRVYHAVEHRETYAWLPATVDVAALQSMLSAKHPRASLIRLWLTTEVVGHSSGQTAPWFYMVETDVRPDAEAEFDQWYGTEHLPGLATVPGTVRARRYVAQTGSPRHYACYDLAQREAFGSPAWLAVRATPWSDRVRPNFMSTKRTMFRLVQDTKEA